MKNVYREMQAYKASLDARIKELSQYADVYPNKHIKIAWEKGNYRFSTYDSAEKSTKYLSRKNDILIKTLSRKRYAEEVISKLNKNLSAAELFLENYSGFEEWQIADACNPALRVLSSEISRDYDAEVEKWAKQEYERNPYFPEFLINPSLRGELYRSKSEAMIADSLYESQLAYLPEPPLRTRGGLIFYPDFKILIPETFEIIYWEHLGRMDDPEYASKNCKKIIKLNEMGIIQGKNLIVTMETKDCPLSQPYVRSVIKTQIFGRV